MSQRVLVLGGGPDAERPVSIKSATAIAEGLKLAGGFDVRLEIIDRLTAEQLSGMPADVIFPYLHGPYGEGGPLQDLLEADGRPYVGSGPRASRGAMDKVNTKMVALDHKIDTPAAWVLNTADPICPTRLPVIIKPVHEGSTIGLHVCTSREEFASAVAAIRTEAATRQREGLPSRSYMIEPKVGGQSPARELTVGLLDGQPLPVIEIKPKSGLYDYEAKYTRDDTGYLFDIDLPEATLKKVAKSTARIAKALAIRHVARADFLIDQAGVAWFLEINTTPGFTDHSLVPKAAKKAGIDMPELCRRLVAMALRDHRMPE